MDTDSHHLVSKGKHKVIYLRASGGGAGYSTLLKCVSSPAVMLEDKIEETDSCICSIIARRMSLGVVERKSDCDGWMDLQQHDFIFIFLHFTLTCGEQNEVSVYRHTQCCIHT